MAILQSRLSGKKVFLHSHHVIGRGKLNNGTSLEQRDVSSVHALIRWDGCQWVIKDLSKNGSWIDQQRLQPGVETVLRTAAELCFGNASAESFVVLDVSAPAASIVMLNSDDYLPLAPVNVLPNEEAPEVTIYLSNTGRWVCENDSETYPLEDGDIIRLKKSAWSFIDAVAIEETVDAGCQKLLDTRNIQFKFNVSLDEEHAFLRIEYDITSLDLGERAHHYLLLILARQKLQDAKQKFDPLEQGWIDIERLSKMLGLDPSHTNIQIFRARKQVSEALKNSLPLPQVVERRKGEVRFGFPCFSIVRGSEPEGSLGIQGPSGNNASDEIS